MKVIILTESQLSKVIDVVIEQSQEQRGLTERGIKGLWKSQWTEDDQILALYHAKYNLLDLGYSPEYIAENIIGTSLASLNQQAANFKSLLGEPGLDRPHKLQSPVFDRYNTWPKIKLKTFCLDIIHKKESEPEQSVIKRKEGKKKDEIDQIRRKSLSDKGFDPNKYKFLSSRPLNPPSDEDDETPTTPQEPETPELSQSNYQNEIVTFLQDINQKVKGIKSQQDVAKLSEDIEFLIEYILSDM